MSKTNAKNKEQYEPPVIFDVKPVSIVRGDEEGSLPPPDGDTEWDGE